MVTLEMLYESVLLDEFLLEAGLSKTPKLPTYDTIKKALIKKYEEAQQRTKSIRPKYREGDTEKLIEILQYVDRFYKDYLVTFTNLALHPETFKIFAQKIKNIDYSWENNIANYVSGGGTVQEFKLTMSDILKSLWDIEIPMTMNEYGFPVYKAHLLHKIIQLKILKDLVQKGKIDPAVQAKVEQFIIDDAVRENLKQNVSDYYKEIRPVKSVEDTNIPKPEPEMEPLPLTDEDIRKLRDYKATLDREEIPVAKSPKSTKRK